MSKSIGNVISALDLLDKFGGDAVRLHFLKEGPFARDESFLEDQLLHSFNAHAVNEYGTHDSINDFVANSLNRVISSGAFTGDGHLEVKGEPSNADQRFVAEFNKISRTNPRT